MVFAKTRKRLLRLYVHYLSFIGLLLRSFYENVTTAWKLLVIHHLANGKSDKVMATLNQ